MQVKIIPSQKDENLENINWTNKYSKNTPDTYTRTPISLHAKSVFHCIFFIFILQLMNTNLDFNFNLAFSFSTIFFRCQISFAILSFGGYI